jgi:hypothetical protein
MPIDPMEFEEESELDRRIPERRGLPAPRSKSPAAPRSNAPRRVKAANGVHKRRRRHYGL